MPYLLAISGPDAGTRFDLPATAVTIGRHSANAIHLTDTQASRKHAELRPTPTGRHQLFDLQSGNGTRVNGRAIQVMELKSGDQIGIGETVLEYASEVEGPDATRLIVRASTEHPSAVLRTVHADAGDLLRYPDPTGTDGLRSRLATLAVLYEVTSATSAILDLDILLGRIVEIVLRTTDADQGCVLLTDAETGELLPKAIRTKRLGGELIVSRTVVDHVLNQKQGVLIADAGTDDRFQGGESIVRHRIREVICVPMKGRHETVGVLFLSVAAGHPSSAPIFGFPPLDAGTRFTADHLTLAIAVGHQAALAVEETRAYQAVLQAERLAAVGQTIAALSHHIKNVMQGVRFGGDMVRMGFADNDLELLRKGWKLVEKNQGRIDDLMLDMLSYSKDREPAIEPTSLAAVAADVLEVVRGRAADVGVELSLDPGDLPVIGCDPDGIHRALLNVVSNAIDACEDASTRQVRVAVVGSTDGKFADITVTDTGPGIALANVADLFKPFVSTKGSRGTGLGLPVSKKILAEHGGDLLVTSTPGEGCQFTLRLPR